MSLYIKGVTSSLGYQQITSLSAATGLGIPSDPSKPPATVAVIIPEGQTVRWRDDGVSPTALIGMPLVADSALVYQGDLASIRFIQTASGAKLNVSYYATATPTPTPTPTPSLSRPVVEYAEGGTATITNYDAAVTYTGVRDDESTFSIASDQFDWKDASHVGFFLAVLAERVGYVSAQSEWHFTPEDLLQWRSEFDGTAGTDMVGYDGWTGNWYYGPADSGHPSAPGGLATGILKLNGSGNLAQYIGSDGAVFTKPVAGNDYEIEVELVEEPTSNKDGNALTVGCRSNGIFWAQPGASSINMFCEGNGNYNYAGGGNANIGRDFVTGDKITLRVLGGRAYAFINGLRPDSDIASNGIDVSSIAAKSKVSLIGSASSGGATWPFDRVRAIEVRSVPSYSFMLNSAVVTGDGTLACQLRVDPSVLHADLALMDDAGFLLAPIQKNVAPTSAGIFPVNMTYSTLAAGKVAYIAARDTANPAYASVVSVGTLSAWQSVTPIMALNLTTPLSNYSATNLMHQGGWAWNAGGVETVYETAVANVGMTDAGDFTIMPAHGISFYFDYSWPDAGSPVYGTYLWTFNSGFTPTAVSGCTLSNVTATTAEVTFNYPVTSTPVIKLTGPVGAIAGGKLISTIYKTGLTAPQKARFYRPEMQTFLAPLQGYRFLFTLDAWPGSERPFITTVQNNDCISWRERRNAAPCPAVMTDLGGAGKHLIFNTSPQWLPNVVRSLCESLTSDCAATIHIRPYNEIWNYGSLSAYIVERATPNFSGGSVALVEGDYVKGATSGYQMIVHKQYVKTGSVGSNNATGYLVGSDTYAYNLFDRTKIDGTRGFIEGETIQRCNSAGTVLDANIGTVAVNSPLNVKYARHAKWLFDMVADIPGATGRFVYGVEWQEYAPWSDMETILDTEDLYTIVRETATAPYGNSWLSGWDNTTYMSQEQKATVASDLTGWKALVAAAQHDDVVAVGDHWYANSKSQAAYNLSKGLAANDIALGTYEVSPNGEYIWDWPSIYFDTGTQAPDPNALYKGRISGTVFQPAGDYDGDPENAQQPYVLTGGSFGSGNATGYFRQLFFRWPSATAYPVSGEIFDKVDNNGTVLQSAVFKAAASTNLCYQAITEHCNFMRSAAFGTNWAYYMSTYLKKTGLHGLFCEGWGVPGLGDRTDVVSESNTWGFWGIGTPDDLTAHPYADIVAALP